MRTKEEQDMTQDATSITEQGTSTIVKENMSLDALDSTEQDMVQDASCSTAIDFKFKEDAEAQAVRLYNGYQKMLLVFPLL